METYRACFLLHSHARRHTHKLQQNPCKLFWGSIWQIEHCTGESKRKSHPCKILAGGRHTGQRNIDMLIFFLCVFNCSYSAYMYTTSTILCTELRNRIQNCMHENESKVKAGIAVVYSCVRRINFRCCNRAYTPTEMKREH